MTVTRAPGPPLPLTGLTELRGGGRMRWTERERGWVAAPDQVVDALVRGGFEECKHAVTSSRRDLRPSGGVWQGVNRVTGSVASAIWITRAAEPGALVFIEIDGDAVRGGRRGARDADGSYQDDGGEG